jgi:hypothetical protein
VCVLLGDGSGGVFFLISSRSICLLVTTMGWYLLWGPFRGIFFGVRSEVVFSLGSVPRVYPMSTGGNAVGA